MKIVYVVDAYYPRLNGVVTCIDASLKYLAGHGHKVFLICPSGYPQEELYPSPIEHIARIDRFPSYPLWYSTNREERQVYPWEFTHVSQVLRDISPDLIHIHTEFALGKMGKKYAFKYKIPCVASAHTYFLPYAYNYFPYLPHWLLKLAVRMLTRSFYRDIDITLTPTTEMKAILENDLKIQSPIRTAFIGIDTSDFQGVDREEERRKSFYFGMFPRWQGRKRLLFVGRMSEEKNLSFLLEAFVLILKHYPNLELIMVGSGSYLQNYREETHRRGIEHNVTFTGPIPHNKLKNVYALADIFTFPSVTESQGLVTVEALYSGLPVVAMDALGTKVVMEGERGGFLVTGLEEFVDKTLILLKDEKIYLAKQQEALKRGAELTFEKTGEILEETYQEVLALPKYRKNP